MMGHTYGEDPIRLITDVIAVLVYVNTFNDVYRKAEWPAAVFL